MIKPVKKPKVPVKKPKVPVKKPKVPVKKPKVPVKNKITFQKIMDMEKNLIKQAQELNKLLKKEESLLKIQLKLHKQFETTKITKPKKVVRTTPSNDKSTMGKKSAVLPIKKLKSGFYKLGENKLKIVR